MEQETQNLIEKALERKSKIYVELCSTVGEIQFDLEDYIRGMQSMIPTDDLLEFLNMIDDEYDLFEEPMEVAFWEYVHTTLYYQTTAYYNKLYLTKPDVYAEQGTAYDKEWFIRQMLDNLDIVSHLTFMEIVYDIDMLSETYGYKLDQLNMTLLTAQKIVETELKGAITGFGKANKAFSNLSASIDVFAEAAGRYKPK